MAQCANRVWELKQPVSPLPPMSQDGLFRESFQSQSNDPDLENALIDGTIAQVHQMTSNAKGGTASGHRALAWRVDDQDRRAC